MSFEAYSEEKLRQINAYIDGNLIRCRESVSQRFAPLIEAMHYSLAGQGKRFRPLLVLASAEYLGLEEKTVLPIACAIEYIHTYSLIHDDLPCMDNDDERRGRPSSHVQFGEAVALLAGDALLTEAFDQMNILVKEHKVPPNQVLEANHLLVQHAGVGGMVGGQLLDTTSENENYTLPELEFIHIHKTGALIRAALLLPACVANANEESVARLQRYGEALGLAFQISDDILDSSPSVRYARKPRSQPRPSYTHLMGASEAKERLNALLDNAVEAVAPNGSRSTHLIEIAEFVRSRKK